MEEQSELQERGRLDRSARTLGRELAIVLIVKLALLAGLWAAFFRAPAPAVDVTRILEPAPVLLPDK